MGLFDSIVKLAKSVTDSVADATSEVTSNTQSYQEETRRLDIQAEADGRPFDEKFKEIVASMPGCSVEYEVSPDFLELQAGRQIYARGGNRCPADNFTYVLSYNGKQVYIRLWEEYSVYDHAANRAVGAYCMQMGMKVLDFFDYMPNGVNYMRDRIMQAFV